MDARGEASKTIFDDLLKNLSSLAYARSSNEKNLLKTILERFNSIDFSSLNLTNEKASLTVNQCCFLASHDDPILVQLVLSLFRKILDQENVSIEGKTLLVAHSWVLECLKIRNNQIINVSLEVLQRLVRGKCGVLADAAEVTLEACCSIESEFAKKDNETFLNCLNCVEALTHCDELTVKDMNAAVIGKACDIYFKFLYNSTVIENPLWRCKCLISAIRGLDNIVRNCPEHIIESLPTIFGVFRGYMLYNVSGFENPTIERVLPSNLAVPNEHKPTKSASQAPLGKYDRKSKKKVPTPIGNVANDEEDPVRSSTYVGTCEVDFMTPKVITSDSDFSDSEGGNAAKIRLAESRVRRCCFILLGSLILKSDSRIITRFLPTILPDGSDASKSIDKCLNHEPSASCRSEILVVLSLILSKFKLFFSLADSLATSSFTALANTVAAMLESIHSSLLAALKKENYNNVTVQILKACSDLIRCTPYQKLRENPLISIAKEVAVWLKRSDVNIRMAALVVFGCITSISPKIPEVKTIICGPDEKSLWLLDQCSMLLTEEKNFNPAVAIESLQVLAALVRNFPKEAMVNHFEDFKIVLEFTSAKYDSMIRLYAAKFTIAAVESLQFCVVCEDERKRVSAGIVANIWSKIIFSAVATMMQEEEQWSLRAAACDCLAALAITTRDFDTSLIFDELPREYQIISITQLSGCTKDSSPQVRSSAVRALAAFVRFDHLRQDPLFFLDAIDAFFVAAADDNINVRIQAAWLLSHVTDAALANHADGLDDDLDNSLIFRIFEAGVSLANDNKKAKPYAVRGIANLLSLLSEDSVREHKEAVVRGMDALLQIASTGTFMKARWNACYAIGIAFTNPAICAVSKSSVLPVLFQLIQSHKNFKVRISAGQALSSLPSRKCYGEFYMQTWQALLTALENADNVMDLSEYKHRDQLIDQICTGLCSLVSIATVADLVPVYDFLLHHIDLLKNNFDRFKNRIVPEKGDVILKADKNLSEMVSQNLNTDQKNALSMLCTIFMQES